MDLQVKKERSEWIDLCKFIAIFYMVWGHAGVPNILDKYIHVFDMPIFFFLSGYLFNISRVKSFKWLLIKKIRTLLVPYFVFSISIYYFWFIAYKIVDSPIPHTQSTLFKALFTFNTTISPFSAVQWFLTCLFLVEIIFYLIIKITKNSKIILISVLVLFSLIGYFYGSSVGLRLYLGLDSAFTALVFYGIGYLFNNIKNCHIRSFIFSPSLFKIAILSILSVVSTLLNGYVNIRTLQYGNYYLYYISSITSIIMYIMIAIYICKIERVRNSKIYSKLIYVGRNTIVVLVLNQLYIKLLNYIAKDIPMINGNAGSIVLSVTVIILMVPTAYLLNKYLPFTIGKKHEKAK